MYSELNKFLSEDYSISYFFDDGFEEGIYILSEFADEDWNLLLVNCNENSDEWKVRLIYCLGAYGDIKGLDVLLFMVMNSSGEVFEYAVDALRDFSPESIEEDERNRVIEKVQVATLKASIVAKKVFEKFLEKYN